LAYGKEEKTIRKAKKNRTSLSDYFSSSLRRSPEDSGFNSMVSPLLTRIHVNGEETKEINHDISMTDQEDEHGFIADLDMMYGRQDDSKIPNFDKQEKECLKQILADVMDISMNEYSMHYVLHSETEFMKPFKDLKNKIKEELFKFYKSSCESTPFKIWSEVVDEHCTILTSFLPACLLKELHEYRFNFVKKYTKNRIKYQLEKFAKTQKKSKTSDSNQSMRVFSANSNSSDPTLLTEEEFLEMVVAEYINTPFHEYLMSCLKKKCSKQSVLSLLSHIKENEVDIMRVYNHNFEVNSSFTAKLKFKNSTIEKYKTPRGFPLKLKPNEKLLYSMDEEVTPSILEKLKVIKEDYSMKKQVERTLRRDEFNSSFSLGSDSCDDDIPFALETVRAKGTNPEKRTSKFDPFSSLKLAKQPAASDVDMEVDEESKSEVSQEQQSERPSLGSISALFKPNHADAEDPMEACPFGNERPSLKGLRLERSSNVSCKPSLPTSSMLRFSDLEKMDDDVDMEERPERLSFKRS
jgi:hypothetical protein